MTRGFAVDFSQAFPSILSSILPSPPSPSKSLSTWNHPNHCLRDVEFPSSNAKVAVFRRRPGFRWHAKKIYRILAEHSVWRRFCKDHSAWSWRRQICRSQSQNWRLSLLKSICLLIFHTISVILQIFTGWNRFVSKISLTMSWHDAMDFSNTKFRGSISTFFWWGDGSWPVSSGLDCLASYTGN